MTKRPGTNPFREISREIPGAKGKTATHQGVLLDGTSNLKATLDLRILAGLVTRAGGEVVTGSDF
jgi:hypothetical protein